MGGAQSDLDGTATDEGPPPAAEGGEGAGTFQVVAAYWQGPSLRVMAADGGGRLRLLPTTGRFHWTAGDESRCVGRIEAGRHRPCPGHRPVSLHAQCRDCTELEEPDCVFEPRCGSDPSACTCSFGTRPHVVYAAFHGILPKIGMTQEGRVATRLREQGADAYFVVRRLAGRAEARRAEKQVAFLYDIPEYRTHRETLPQLAKPVPWDAIGRRAADLRAEMRHRGEGPEALARIDDHPLPLPLGTPPQRVPPAGTHAGTWVGAKGPHLIYRPARDRRRRLTVDVDGPFAALKVGDLVGRSLAVAATQE